MFKNSKILKKSGYTMIEILVVMSIIGFIVAAVWYSIDYSRRLARDTKRVADLSQIQKALETFKNEKGRYPDVTNDLIDIMGECVGDQNSGGTDRSGITPCGNTKKFELAMKDYIVNIPADPSHNHNCGVGGGLPADCSEASNTKYYYSYDSLHPDGAGSNAPVLCFNKAESGKYNCSGAATIYNPLCGSTAAENEEMAVRGAAYCIVLK